MKWWGKWICIDGDMYGVAIDIYICTGTSSVVRLHAITHWCYVVKVELWRKYICLNSQWMRDRYRYWIFIIDIMF